MQDDDICVHGKERDTPPDRCADFSDLAPVADFTIRGGVILKVNRCAASLLGAKKNDLVRQLMVRFIVPEDRESYERHCQEVLNSETPQECELRMLKADGTAFWALMRTVAIPCSDGTFVYRMAVDDITVRKRAGQALVEAEEQVRRLNDQLLKLVMALSHDIRGPLVAIGATLKLMLRGAYGNLDESLANTVRDLLSRCSRLLGTAEDYLGKVSAIGHAMNMRREVLDLREDIIDPVLDELSDELIRQEIVIDNRFGSIPAGSVAISADKTWLKAVYRNLFTNAVKYGGKGCTISFGYEVRGSHYLLNVYNSGRPISEEDRERIFARFGRLQSADGSGRDGIGLGLYLCREIIREHGGEIWCERRAEGVNFVFTVSREDRD